MHYIRFTYFVLLSLVLAISIPCQAKNNMIRPHQSAIQSIQCTKKTNEHVACAYKQSKPFDAAFIAKDIIGEKNAKLAFAFSVDGAKPMGYRAQEKAILMSVFKFHLALAFLDYSREKKIALDNTHMRIPASVWELDTWSPLRKRYRGKSVTLSLSNLLTAAVRDSDNIATDLLIDYMGGMSVFHERLKAMAVEGFNLEVNEAQMHSDQSSIFRNAASPAAVVISFQDFLRQSILEEKDRSYLYNLLVSCSTGKNKMRALLPKGSIMGNKTGTSPRSDDGLRYSDNDAGFIILPDERILYISIFVQDSMESDESNAAIIAELTKRIYDYVLQIPAK